jgi:hypothetical protein
LRSSGKSCALYTIPIPPAPSFAVMR